VTPPDADRECLRVEAAAYKLVAEALAPFALLKLHQTARGLGVRPTPTNLAWKALEWGDELRQQVETGTGSAAAQVLAILLDHYRSALALAPTEVLPARKG